MKKFALIIYGILTLLFIVSANLPAEEDYSLYPTEIRKIKERGYLKVAQFGGERGGFFAYDDENKSPAKQSYDYNGRRLVGFDIDLSLMIAKQLGVELRINREYGSFNEVAQAVAKGEEDIAVSKLSLTPNRAQFVHYTRPYIKLRMGVLINRLQDSKLEYLNKDENNPLGTCFIKGIKLGVLGNSSFVEHGRKNFPEAKIVEFDGREKLFDAVKNGKVLAVLYEEYEISRAARIDPDLAINCRTEYFEDKNDYIAIAVKPEAKTLQEFLNILLDKENIKPSIQALLNNYVPEDGRDNKDEKVKAKINMPGLYTTIFIAGIFMLLWIASAKNFLQKKITEKDNVCNR